MSVAAWIVLIIAIVIVLIVVTQLPQLRRYLRIKHM
jgi:hypothetical protein